MTKEDFNILEIKLKQTIEELKPKVVVFLKDHYIGKDLDDEIAENLKRIDIENPESFISEVSEKSRYALNYLLKDFTKWGDKQETIDESLSNDLYEFYYSCCDVRFIESDDFKKNIDRYSKSKVLHFENKDVLITDPCYVITDRDANYWNLQNKNITNYLVRDTLYGDWSCTVFNKDTTESLGNFCADAGLVGVFDLEEVIKAYPDAKKFVEENTWCASVIHNFTGDIYADAVYAHHDYSLKIYGEGNINFFTSQTGF